MCRDPVVIAGFVNGKDAYAPMRVVQGWCTFIGMGLSWLGLSSPRSRLDSLFWSIIANPAIELKIVHRAFWKFALWPGINHGEPVIIVLTSSGGKFIMGPGLSQEDL